MHNLWIFLAAFILTGVRPVFANLSQANCVDVDFTKRFAPPKDQGNAGFCYSFTASDLLSEAAGINPPDTASAFQIASQYISMDQQEVLAANKAIIYDNGNISGSGFGMGMSTNSQWTSFNNSYRVHNVEGKPLLKREGGQTDLIMAHIINQNRICLEKDISSQLIGRSYKDSDQQNFFSMKMGELAGGREINEFMQAIKNNCPPKNQLPGLNQLIPLKQAIQDWAAKKLRENTNQLCKNPKTIKDMSVHSKSFRNPAGDGSASLQMMSLLDKGRPFALHYNTCLIEKCKIEEDVAEKRWHASVVVGRRWNKKKNICELKIKNSWGKNCETAKTSDLCKDGFWWVDTNLLDKSPTEVIWIDKNNQ